ncbi:MAG TPA: hypothetical protein VFQ53_42060 [Kofleriaceae bacterium]|nr:hypothetical protein [Kofleriaceae bacterium]
MALLTALATTASADPDPSNNEIAKTAELRTDAYVGGGGMLSQDEAVLAGAYGEGGIRIAGSPVFAHVLVQGGTAVHLFADNGGSFYDLRGGAEARGCIVRGSICGSAGLDLGVHRGTYVTIGEALFETEGQEMSEHFASTLVVPRLAVDYGEAIRFRGMIEAPYYVDTSGQHESHIGASFSMGFVASW